MARVLVVTNRKGGTGKTATAVNLAAELAANGERVLLVDLDTQGHCAVGLGIPVKKGEPTVHDLFASGAPLVPALRGSAWDKLHLLPADPLFERGFYLATNSPCVNVGSQSAAAAGLGQRPRARATARRTRSSVTPIWASNAASLRWRPSASAAASRSTAARAPSPRMAMRASGWSVSPRAAMAIRRA